MDRPARFLLPAAAGFAAAFLACLSLPTSPALVTLKALPVLSLALLAALRLDGVERALLVPALLASASGDVLLEWDRERLFVAGMLAFLVTQVLYSLLFLRGARWRRRAALVLLPVLATNALLLPRYWEAAPQLVLPGTVYLAALSVMAVAAATSRHAWTLVLGALLFFVSDHLIAVSAFIGPFPLSRAAIMVSYYTAQLLIVATLVLPGRDKEKPAA